MSKKQRRNAVAPNSRGSERNVDPPLDARETDIVIPVMGETGAGKSSFINLILEHVGSRRDRVKVGDQLTSCTFGIEAVVIEGQTTQGRARFINITDRHRLVLVDTTGFNHARTTDAETLKSIKQWLAEPSRRKMIFGGVIFLHDISQDRISETAVQSLHVVSYLRGTRQPPEALVLVTTKWSRERDSNFRRREKELKDRYWRGLLPTPGTLGAHVMRLDPRNESKSAWGAVRHILVQLDRRLAQAALEDVLQNQDESVKKKKSIPETEAAKELREELQAALRVQEEILALEASAAEGDLEAEAKIREKEDRLREMQDAIQASKVSFFSRSQSFFRRLF